MLPTENDFRDHRAVFKFDFVEAYRLVAWMRQEAPAIITGAFCKDGDPPDARPAVAIELTLSQHDVG